ncbi:MAG: WGR domain-containing protein [Archangium sp.]|nr:WGR domain-containing protein [Archangium sp.]
MSGKRYFEFSEGTSNKFWEVWIEGNSLMTRYGKIGANGQQTVKDEGSPAGAQKLYDKLIREKTGKGYVEKGGGGNGAAAPAAAKPAPAAKKEAAPAAAPRAAAGPVQVEEGFRRFEFVEGTSSKFWEVKVEGEQQVIRFGKIGTAGQTKEKDFDSGSEAKADTKKLIAEKTGKGYVEVGGKAKAEGNPELEKKILENLNDAAPYLVYADWLQGKGDPQGELIVMQTNKSASAKAHLKKHAETFLGPLAKFPTGEKYGKGYDIEWQFGFMKELTIRWETFGYDSEDDPNGDLSAILELPTAKFLQKLTLGPCAGEDEHTFDGVIEAIAEKKPTTLRELYLGEIGDWDISSTFTGDFSEIAPVLPNLERLTLRSGNITIGKNVSLPELKELTIETGGFSKGDLKQLLAIKAPKLEKLHVWFGDDNYGGDCDLKSAMPIIDGSAFPKVTDLGIMNCAFVGEAAAALAKSKLLKQLKRLDLSMGCLSDKDIDTMVANKAAFAHLEHLNLDDNALTDASKPRVKGLAKEVNFGKEQEPDRAGEDAYRYVSVGE